MGSRTRIRRTLAAAEKRWGHEVTVSAIVALIRRFEPEVVVTHDLDGEYGHGAHRATALCTLEAVSAAADGTLFPESADLYGAWQVKKLYLHLYDTGTVTMDWRVPLAAFDGQTALDVANEAYAMHVSQQEYHQNVYDSGDFSSAEFGLAYTTVGQDAAGGDFFENIPPDALTNYVFPTPSPSPGTDAGSFAGADRRADGRSVERAASWQTKRQSDSRPRRAGHAGAGVRRRALFALRRQKRRKKRTRREAKNR